MLLFLSRKLKDNDAKIQDLEIKIIIDRAEVIYMKAQLSIVKTVCNQAFGYNYGPELECLRSFLVELTSLNIEDLNPYPISQQQLNPTGSQ